VDGSSRAPRLRRAVMGHISFSQLPRVFTFTASARASSSVISSSVRVMLVARTRPSTYSGLVTPMIGVEPFAIAHAVAMPAADASRACRSWEQPVEPLLDCRLSTSHAYAGHSGRIFAARHANIIAN
jgi:hypothetical protein